MIQDPPNKTWIVIIIAIIGATGVICAAIIGLGEPFVDHIADTRFPSVTQTHVIFYQQSNQAVTPDSLLVEKTPIPTISIKSEEIPSPLRPHKAESIGTGVFENATYSDGNAEFTDEKLNGSYYRILPINSKTTSSGCGISIYKASEVWFGSARKTTLYINGTAVGETYFGTGKHGHIIPVSIEVGDELCVSPIPPDGFLIYIGPDTYYHYDSFCYRGYCD